MGRAVSLTLLNSLVIFPSYCVALSSLNKTAYALSCVSSSVIFGCYLLKAFSILKTNRGGVNLGDRGDRSGGR